MLTFIILVCSSTIVLQEVVITKEDSHRDWQSYKLKYGLKFDEPEEARRINIYLENKRYIMEHNAKNSDFILAMNRYGHMEGHEHKACYIGNISRSAFRMRKNQASTDLPLPNSVDWRENGYVSPVKDQGPCGSCYAFGAIAAIESHFAINTGKMVNMSEQEIVDCSGSFGDQGCNGGIPDYVFEYVMKNGITLLSDYEYYAVKQFCQANRFKHSFKLISYVDIPSGDENSLVRALAFHGPISIAIDASSREFRFYESGVFKFPNCSSEDLDHAVLAVGYKKDFNPYIIVKNSWGTAWGDGGYIKMALFKDNQCGIATQASYPLPKL